MAHPVSMTIRTFVAVAALLPAVFLVACNGDDDDATPTASSSQTAASSTVQPSPTSEGTATPEASATAGPFGGGTAAVTATPPAGLTAPVVQAMRAAAQDGFDRLVFEFSGDKVPGYTVQYDTKAIACGSGQDLTSFIGGGTAPVAMLTVKIQPANAHTETGAPSVARDLNVGLSTIKRAFGTCDFEADVTYAVALSAEKPFKVSTLSNPPRLVIDVGQ